MRYLIATQAAVAPYYKPSDLVWEALASAADVAYAADADNADTACGAGSVCFAHAAIYSMPLGAPALGYEREIMVRFPGQITGTQGPHPDEGGYLPSDGTPYIVTGWEARTSPIKSISIPRLWQGAITSTLRKCIAIT